MSEIKKQMDNLANLPEAAYNGIQQAIQDMADNFAPVLDKLAGTHSEMKLSFKDLTVDTGQVKAKVQGYLLLSADYSEEQSTSVNQMPNEPQPSGVTTISKTDVTNVTLE